MPFAHLGAGTESPRPQQRRFSGEAEGLRVVQHNSDRKYD